MVHHRDDLLLPHEEVPQLLLSIGAVDLEHHVLVLFARLALVPEGHDLRGLLCGGQGRGVE